METHGDNMLKFFIRTLCLYNGWQNIAMDSADFTRCRCKKSEIKIIYALLKFPYNQTNIIDDLINKQQIVKVLEIVYFVLKT